MSMLCTVSRITASQIAAMRSDPAVADQLLHERLPVVPARPGLFARMLGLWPGCRGVVTVAAVYPGLEWQALRLACENIFIRSRMHPWNQ